MSARPAPIPRAAVAAFVREYNAAGREPISVAGILAWEEARQDMRRQRRPARRAERAAASAARVAAGARVVALVAAARGLALEDLTGNEMRDELVLDARREAAWVMRDTIAGIRLHEIGTVLGGRHKRAIEVALSRVQARIDADPALALRLRALAVGDELAARRRAA